MSMEFTPTSGRGHQPRRRCNKTLKASDELHKELLKVIPRNVTVNDYLQRIFDHYKTCPKVTKK